jgi:ribosomal protein L27
MKTYRNLACYSLLVLGIGLPVLAQNPQIDSVQGREVVAGEIIVRFRGATLAQSQALAAQDPDIISTVPVGSAGAILLRSRGRDTAALMQAYAARADVLYAEPNYVMRALVDIPSAASPGSQRMQKMELPDFARASDIIVQGRVERVESRKESDTTHTDTTIVVDDQMKGAQKQSFVIRSEGGRAGDSVRAASDMAQFQVGESVIVFLKESTDGVFELVGGIQGKFEIVGDSVVSNVSDILIPEILDPQSGMRASPPPSAKASLEAFKARIRELVR